MKYLQKYLDKKNGKQTESATISYLAALDHLNEVAPEICSHIIAELKDQRSNLKLIASENYSSLSVQLAMGNLLTDKYAEGFPGHRFYAGCQNVDKIELDAKKEAEQLFSADHAYVQPHSGSDANLVAFWSILTAKIQDPNIEKLGKKNLESLSNEEFESIRKEMLNQKMMGMSLNSGGHLSHGYRRNVSAKFFQAVPYDVDPKTEMLDYSALAMQVKKEKPLILLAGYSAYPRLIDFSIMKEIAESVNAALMVDMAHFAGLVAGKAITGNYNPIPFADIITTTTHKTLRGPRGGMILCKKEYAEIVDRGCPMLLGGPLPHIIASKAIAFKEARTPNFEIYSKKIIENAKALAESLTSQGIRLVTGGTENHILILDVTSFGLTGKQAEEALRACGLTVNRNTIPFDKNSAWFASGIRIGTPAVTTLGMGNEQMREIAAIIDLVLSHTHPNIIPETGKPSKKEAQTDQKIQLNAKARVKDLLSTFPLYPEIAIDNPLEKRKQMAHN